MFKNRKLFVVLAIVLLLLAACAEDPTPTPEPAPEPTEAPAEEPAEEPEEEPAEELTEEPAEEPEEEPAEEPAAEEEMAGPIYIGGIHPLTGGLAADGIQMDNAIQMAIDELNEAGGALDGVEFALQRAVVLQSSLHRCSLVVV